MNIGLSDILSPHITWSRRWSATSLDIILVWTSLRQGSQRCKPYKIGSAPHQLLSKILHIVLSPPPTPMWNRRMLASVLMHGDENGHHAVNRNRDYHTEKARYKGRITDKPMGPGRKDTLSCEVVECWSRSSSLIISMIILSVQDLKLRFSPDFLQP